MALWGRRKSPVPRHTRQNRPEVRRPTECNQRTGEERPHTNALERRRGLFVAASHQTRLDTRSKARRPIKVGIKVGGKVGNEPRLEPCWSVLLIGSLSAMWAWWGKQFHEPKSGSGHVCRVMAWTRHQGLVPYIGFEKVCICHCLPPDRTWHEVKSPKAD